MRRNCRRCRRNHRPAKGSSRRSSRTSISSPHGTGNRKPPSPPRGNSVERWRPRRLMWRRPAPPLSRHRQTVDSAPLRDRDAAAARRRRISRRDASVPPAAAAAATFRLLVSAPHDEANEQADNKDEQPLPAIGSGAGAFIGVVMIFLARRRRRRDDDHWDALFTRVGYNPHFGLAWRSI